MLRANPEHTCGRDQRALGNLGCLGGGFDRGTWPRSVLELLAYVCGSRPGARSLGSAGHSTTAGLEALLSWLTESGCTHVPMEATGVYWKPVWNILSEGKFELMVANAAHQERARPQDGHE
jgi:hypothetical protein